MNHTLCQLSYFAFHTQAQINPPGCSSTPIGEPWFLPQSVALPLVSLTPSLNICILYNVLRWIWTIDLLIFNQSHLPLSYQDDIEEVITPTNFIGSATAVNHKKDTESSFAKIEDKNLWNFSNWNATHSGSDFKECPTSGELIYDFGAVQTLLKLKILRSATKLVGHFLFKIRTIRNA